MDERELESYIGALGELAAPGGHPGLALLVAYQDDELAPDETERIQAHLVRCRECADTLLGLHQTLEGDHPEEDPADLETRWRAIRAEAERRPDARPRMGRWLYAAGLAAALALGLFVGAWWRAPGPVANPIYMELYPDDTRTRGDTLPSFPVPPRDGFVFVTLTLGRPVASNRFEIRLLRQGVSSPLVRLHDVRRQDDFSFLFALPHGRLKPGGYLIQLIDAEGSEVAEYRFAMVRPEK